MNPRKLTDRVTVVNADVVEGYGGAQVRDWANGDVSALVPALVQFLGTSEDDADRNATDTSWRVVLLGRDIYGQPVTMDDASRVRWPHAAGDLEVTGALGVFSRNGAVDHYEATVRLVTDSPVTTDTIT